MTAFNPITAILTQNKLKGPNYVDWKQNMDVVLIAEEFKFVLDEVCPEKPGEDATDDEQKAYQKWVKADEMAQCYILASMSNVLQHQHPSMEFAYDILENLKEMFGDQNRAAKQAATKALLNTKMVEGSSVRDHVLKKMSLLNELELAETIIKRQAPPVALNFEIGSSSKPRVGQKKKKTQKPSVGGATAGIREQHREQIGINSLTRRAVNSTTVKATAVYRLAGCWTVPSGNSTTAWL
ncbi:PREDICTED: uncharacterized protein LOC109232484 [Nicotiana attenuata]|uniref:uncharacterized protein LOC109232484 n=1 Tax=Nicotiana attenuata TaxID=49451 RepID=UPI000905CE1E|nr:PREDICTED: uncharacterized protein LOC109232484 [Nicotiana attenuata]